MIKIKKTDYTYEVIRDNKKIIIPTEMFKDFQENLFVSYGDREEQITIEDLSYVDFNLIFYKHIPHYSDLTQRKLDMKLLKSVCDWSSETIYRNIEI